MPKPSTLGKRPLQDNPKPVLGNQIPRDVPKTTLLGGFFMPSFLSQRLNPNPRLTVVNGQDRLAGHDA